MTKNNKLKKYNKLEISIFAVSVIQLLSYLLTLFVIYDTNHDDNPSDFDGMGALFPAFTFIFFGAINLIIFIIYLMTRYKSKSQPSRIVLIFIGALILLALLAGNVIDYVDTL